MQLVFRAVLAAVCLTAGGCRTTQQAETAASHDAGRPSNIYIVRHAQTEKNAGLSCREDAFSPLGIQQIAALTDKLGADGVHFDKVLVSPLWRTHQTIAPFLAKYPALYDHAGVAIEDGLAECCWDVAHDRIDAVREAAHHVRGMVEASSRPLNILIVTHYFSGGDFSGLLFGQVLKLANAKVQMVAVPKLQPGQSFEQTLLPTMSPAGTPTACERAEAAKCVDRAPDKDHSCKQQKDWGKCNEDWMFNADYCAKTCMRCSAD